MRVDAALPTPRGREPEPKSLYDQLKEIIFDIEDRVIDRHVAKRRLLEFIKDPRLDDPTNPTKKLIKEVVHRLIEHKKMDEAVVILRFVLQLLPEFMDLK